MHIKCESNVNYLFQKSTRPNKQGITLFRNQQSQICLAIGKERKGAVTFKLEESLSKIYSDFVSEGKLSFELQLTGGTCVNILINTKKENAEDLLPLLNVLNVIYKTPEKAYEIDLRDLKDAGQENEEEEED